VGTSIDVIYERISLTPRDWPSCRDRLDVGPHHIGHALPRGVVQQVGRRRAQRKHYE
jgi:hypothetical protein